MKVSIELFAISLLLASGCITRMELPKKVTGDVAKAKVQGLENKDAIERIKALKAKRVSAYRVESASWAKLLPSWGGLFMANAEDETGDPEKFRSKVKEKREALDRDFNVVLGNSDYLQKYDAEGRLRAGYVALKEYVSGHRNVEKLTWRQACHVAYNVLENLEQFDDLKEIWKSKLIGYDLRKRALDFMHHRLSQDLRLYEAILDAPCCTNAMLLEIMKSSTSRMEVSAAHGVLWRRGR